jgi:hypothetical protein
MTDTEKTGMPEMEAGEVRPVKKQKLFSKSLHDILGGDYLSKEFVISNIPFLLYVAVLAIIYIGNTYYSEKTFKEIEKTKNELKELRFQYLTTKSNLMFFSKQSEIAGRVEKFGLKQSTTPPYRIFYSHASLKKDIDSNRVSQ